ncbi:MAG: hypothetical protein PHT95_04695, partial [Candidatus Omnitrophica bacterium]|nr:hypothetical protein [Candidatus Omnitrophota bacterium]
AISMNDVPDGTIDNVFAASVFNDECFMMYLDMNSQFWEKRFPGTPFNESRYYRRIAREFHRILKPGGKLFFSLGIGGNKAFEDILAESGFKRTFSSEVPFGARVFERVSPEDLSDQGRKEAILKAAERVASVLSDEVPAIQRLFASLPREGQLSAIQRMSLKEAYGKASRVISELKDVDICGPMAEDLRNTLTFGGIMAPFDLVNPLVTLTTACQIFELDPERSMKPGYYDIVRTDLARVSRTMDSLKKIKAEKIVLRKDSKGMEAVSFRDWEWGAQPPINAHEWRAYLFFKHGIETLSDPSGELDRNFEDHIEYAYRFNSAVLLNGISPAPGEEDMFKRVWEFLDETDAARLKEAGEFAKRKILDLEKPPVPEEGTSIPRAPPAMPYAEPSWYRSPLYVGVSAAILSSLSSLFLSGGTMQTVISIFAGITVLYCYGFGIWKHFILENVRSGKLIDRRYKDVPPTMLEPRVSITFNELKRQLLHLRKGSIAKDAEVVVVDEDASPETRAAIGDNYAAFVPEKNVLYVTRNLASALDWILAVILTHEAAHYFTRSEFLANIFTARHFLKALRVRSSAGYIDGTQGIAPGPYLPGIGKPVLGGSALFAAFLFALVVFSMPPNSDRKSSAVSERPIASEVMRPASPRAPPDGLRSLSISKAEGLDRIIGLFNDFIVGSFRSEIEGKTFEYDGESGKRKDELFYSAIFSNTEARERVVMVNKWLDDNWEMISPVLPDYARRTKSGVERPLAMQKALFIVLARAPEEYKTLSDKGAAIWISDNVPGVGYTTGSRGSGMWGVPIIKVNSSFGNNYLGIAETIDHEAVHAGQMRNSAFGLYLSQSTSFAVFDIVRDMPSNEIPAYTRQTEFMRRTLNIVPEEGKEYLGDDVFLAIGYMGQKWSFMFINAVVHAMNLLALFGSISWLRNRAKMKRLSEVFISAIDRLTGPNGYMSPRDMARVLEALIKKDTAFVMSDRAGRRFFDEIAGSLDKESVEDVDRPAVLAKLARNYLKDKKGAVEEKTLSGPGSSMPYAEPSWFKAPFAAGVTCASGVIISTLISNGNAASAVALLAGMISFGYITAFYLWKYFVLGGIRSGRLQDKRYLQSSVEGAPGVSDAVTGERVSVLFSEIARNTAGRLADLSRGAAGVTVVSGDSPEEDINALGGAWARFYPRKNMLYVNGSLARAPDWVLAPILSHEAAHYFLKSEILADLFAVLNIRKVFRIAASIGYSPEDYRILSLIDPAGEERYIHKHSLRNSRLAIILARRMKEEGADISDDDAALLGRVFLAHDAGGNAETRRPPAVRELRQSLEPLLLEKIGDPEKVVEHLKLHNVPVFDGRFEEFSGVMRELAEDGRISFEDADWAVRFLYTTNSTIEHLDKNGVKMSPVEELLVRFHHSYADFEKYALTEEAKMLPAGTVEQTRKLLPIVRVVDFFENGQNSFKRLNWYGKSHESFMDTFDFLERNFAEENVTNR